MASHVRAPLSLVPRPGSRETGSAELKEKDGVTTLTLAGTDAMGVKLELTVIAQPRKK